MRNKPKMGESSGNPYLEGFQELSGVYGLEYLEANLDQINPQQAEELIAEVSQLHPDPNGVDFEKVRDLLGHVLNSLQEKVNAEVAPESMEEKTPAPELRVAKSLEEEEAYGKVSHIAEVFEIQQEYKDKSTAEKVGRWLEELNALDGVVDNDTLGPIIGKLMKWQLEYEGAQKARQKISQMPSGGRRNAPTQAEMKAAPAQPKKKRSLWSRLIGK